MANHYNVWSGFGLKASPFFNQPLEPDPGHPTRPITLFMGRDEETRLLTNRVMGGRSSVSLVTGKYGVGKTTFLHHMEYELGQDGSVYVPPAPVRLTSSTSPEVLGAEVLRRLVGAVDQVDTLRDMKGSRVYKDADRTVNNVDRVTASISVLGIGGGMGRTADAPPFPIHDTITLAHELASRIQRERPEQKILLHLDNLENVYDPMDPSPAWRMFRDVRDLLQLDGVHFLMAGGSDFYRSVIQKEEKVSDVVGMPVILHPLHEDTAWQVLEVRIQFLSREYGGGKTPITPEAFRALHEAYGGNLRGMFGLAETIFQARPPREFEPMGWEDLVPKARDVATDHLRSMVSGKDIGYLQVVYDGFAAGEFRQKELTGLFDLTQPSLSRALDRWSKQRLVEIVREEPPSRYFRLSGLVLIGFGWNP